MLKSDQTIDIIMLGATRWDFSLASSTFSIAQALAKTHRVLYIERPFTLKDAWDHKNEAWFQYRKKALYSGNLTYKKLDIHNGNLISITPGLLYPINFLPAGKLYDWFSLLNEKILNKNLEQIIKDFKVKKYIYINSFYPYYLHKISPSNLQPMISMYRSVDDISQEKYIAKHGIKGEEKAVKYFDLITASASQLCNKLSVHGKNVKLVPNAVDYDVFQAASVKLPQPDELKTIERKKVIFTGNLNELRTDFNLLVKCLNAYPKVVFIMVGPYDIQAIKKYKLSTYDNLVFTGEKPSNLLPSFLSNCDVGIIPFLKNKLTKSIYPLKINEYLAAGLPVVSTEFSAEVKSFSDCSYVANNHDDFLAQLDTALNENSEIKKQERIARAKENTWENRIELIWKYLQEAYEEKSK